MIIELFPIYKIVLLSYQKTLVNVILIVITLIVFTVFCNVIAGLVEMLSFATIKFDKICKYKMINYFFELFDGNNAKFVVFKSKR